MTILEPTLAGAVGPQAAGELCNFLAMAKQMPDPAKVLADPARAPIPNDASVQWALVTALADSGVTLRAVVDLRAGYRWQPHVLVAAVLENLANAPYRYHGSSINGPGRSLNLLLEFGY